ncbi:hypothetical protein ACIPIN_05375 [Pseudomonas sp. NPDC087697]|uniref:hypothetical protein n=1 Tax=Pseudomonas sp. NPDC087697 TaxID=3364447 RepID=UPI0037F41D4B
MMKVKVLILLIKSTALFSSLCFVSSTNVVALTQEITATFNPDSANPQHNEFINKTPNSGYCSSYLVDCKNLGIFSLSIPVSFYSQTAIRPNEDDPRQNPMFKVPSTWRSVNVRNTVTGESETVEVRIAGVGSVYHLPVPVEDLTGGGNHHALWKGNSWSYPAPPCVRTDLGYGHSTLFVSFWTVPEGSRVCFKQALFMIPNFRYSEFQFSYQLKTPKPLTMSSGHYVGTLNYTIGPGGDFDMGDVMQPDDTALTLNFTLDVQHTLKVDLPPGGEKIRLVPPGGWQSWLQAGRRPVRLSRDQTFNISASTRFKMSLECEYSSFPYDCIIRDLVSGHYTPLIVRISLPNGLTDLAGQSVKHRRLFAGPASAQHFQPGFYVDRAPGILHFEVPEDQMYSMIQPGVARTYSGNVTVIWDSEA